MVATGGSTAAGKGLAPYLPLVRVVLYAAGLIGVQLTLMFVAPPDDPMAVFGENGRLEIAQVVLLGIGFWIVAAIGRGRDDQRALAIVLAGLIVAVVVREHNNDLKRIDVPRLWQLLVGVVLGITLALAWPRRRTIPSALAGFLRTQGFAWCAAGVFTLLFVQALDEKSIWVAILGEEFPYAARRVGEETCELLGYWLFVVGLFEWRLALGRRTPDGGGAPTEG